MQNVPSLVLPQSISSYTALVNTQYEAIPDVQNNKFKGQNQIKGPIQASIDQRWIDVKYIIATMV